jgi:bifunctional DNA-binding transcriptional regulator/antitoxin component of YhaV-PrlF toxin-antitoxin module
MQEIITQVTSAGLIPIPNEFQKILGLVPGDTIIIKLEKDEILVIQPKNSLKHAQELIRHYIPKGKNLSDELIQERRGEALSE